MKTPNPTQVARAERMRLATETGAQAMAEAAAKDVAVRKNMARLRELRLAREADEASQAKPERAKSKVLKRAKAAPKKLSEWIAGEQAAGRKT